jgi:hypothetical protein
MITWDAGRLAKIDTILIAAREGDVNNAFDKVAEPFYTNFYEDGTNVFVFETPKGVRNVNKVLSDVDNKNSTSDSRARTTTIVLAAHGAVIDKPEGGKDVTLDDLGIDKQTDLYRFAKLIDKIGFTGNPTIVLNSCLTGKQLDAEDSIAKHISAKTPKATVIAPDQVIIDMAKTEDGRLNFTNTYSDGRVVNFNLDSGTESTILRGTLVRAKTMVYKNGELVFRSLDGHLIKPAGPRINLGHPTSTD